MLPFDVNPAELLTDVRVANLIDVAIVALLLYLALLWLRRELNRTALVAAAIAAALFAAARTFELYMTEMVVQGLLAFLAIAAVVVFQSDIRRIFDRIGHWRLWRRPTTDRSSEIANILAEATARMAESRTGALIALRGRESWQEHIEGGVELDGRISETLLVSLFNTDAPGHDGAVLIDRGRITHFAAHLPLSGNRAALGAGGTRHAAALGLSERCDALLVVVSEERGQVSIGQAGELTGGLDAGEVGERVSTFLREQAGLPTNGRPRRIGAHLRSAALALGIASLAWFFLVYQAPMVSRTFDAPVEMRNVPESWRVEAAEPRIVQVTLRGREQTIRRIDPAQVAVSLEAVDLAAGRNELAVTEARIRHRPGVEIERIAPRVVIVQAQPLEPVRMAVTVQTRGAPPEGYMVVSTSADPASVMLWLPEERSGEVEAVLTEPIDLAELREPTSREVGLVVPEAARLSEPETAQVTVTIEVRREGAEEEAKAEAKAEAE